MSIQEDLALFYDDQATKYAQTREKYRSEADLFLDEIQSNPNKTLRILEFGCGSGRLLAQLESIKNKKIHYVGVDLSKKLLSIAKKQVKPTNKTLSCTFICDDILHYI
jgi:ubiquinone/menaquinone biosynthesis C-methylase UbiE